MPPADSYSSFERRLLGPVRGVALGLLRPLVILLARLGISPNAVSLSQIMLGLIVFFVIVPYPRTAFLLMVLAIVLDGVDGALARYTGKASRYGALIDQYADHVREILVVAGLAYAGALNGAWAALYALAYTGCNLTLYICNAHGVPIPLAVKTAFVFYPALFVYLWFGVNYLDPAVTLIVVLMSAVVIQGLWKLRTVMS
jgi:CDP-diacylglycerol--glycerol-3-phosphate 3-phosphatidyltransferase